MFVDNLKKLLSQFNYIESKNLLNEIDLHRKFGYNGPPLSLEEERLYDQLFNMVIEYSKYH